MNVFRYETDGGKDVIINYVDKLPKRERATYYAIQAKLEEDGLKALDSLTTRQLRKKLWEIKATKNRYMYVLADEDNIYILHACRKQKGKAEKFELSKAIKRAEELGKELGKSFV
ncbi:type II toxin-antitoxin system RelE/ParE family toxin [Clostridium sp.]|mgnify:CR=1 FL=1|uniref:type II toxin-antitoxin system RelE/ParE family toxin n=1 Tax=Clostridium sp. TaxID=1506 RepID=UPI0039953180